MHASATEFFEFAFNNFGHPDFAIECQAEEATILNRFKQVNEIAEELDETQQKTISDDKEKFEQTKEALKSFCEQIQDLVERQNRSTTDVDFKVKAQTKPDRITIKTDGSEAVGKQLRAHFSPLRVLVVNHEKRLDIDTACSNLAIKYNMIYLSVYQLIKKHVTECTALG